MPNWCENNLSISHPDPAKMAELREIVQQDNGFLQKLLPCPQPLIDTVAGFGGNNESYENELTQFKTALNMKWFGFANWYEWCNANWGTKWDICEFNIIEESDSLIVMSFSSAWSPPIQAYEALSKLGYLIEASYFEGGCAFCGKWFDGTDEYYDIEECNAKWVRENIPPELDEEFSISFNYEAWEEFDNA